MGAVRLRPAATSLVLAGVLVSVAAPIAIGAVGCTDDTTINPVVFAVDAGSMPEGGDAANRGPHITVTTLAPRVASAPAAKASATWAAYRIDDGEWIPLSPASEGTYELPEAKAKWAIALVCASEDDALSTVFVHHRTIASKSVEVALEEQCTPSPPPEELTIRGNLLNVPAATQWLEFGYALDSRGVAIPISGTTVPYEEVGIAAGTWDLAFGIRGDSFGPYTKIVMRRGEPVTGDKTLDVDIAGPGAFVPESQPLMLRGIIVGDTVVPQILYGTGGPYGIALGPDEVPVNQTQALLAYSTVPRTLQVPSDRYRGTLTAEQDRRAGTRTIAFDVHEAIPLDLTFLPEPPAPVLKALTSMPFVRLETKFQPLANAVSHEVHAEAQINRRTVHAWHATFDAASVAGASEIVDTMPDLSALPGWKPEWVLPPGIQLNVFAIGVEAPQPLGDGTMQRSASKAASLEP